MLFSIITPTFNSCQYLPGAIESVGNQTYDHVEHIVIDGDSSDGTPEFLATREGLRWISEPDGGMYEAVNKGLKMARGDLVAYVNADDRYLPDTLETVAQAFQADPSLDFAYGYCTYITPEEKPICTFRTLPFLPSLFRKGRITFAQPSCFWRRSVHERIGYFDPAFKNSADADFFRRLLAAGAKGRLVRRPLSRFMVRDDCISKTLAENMRREEETISKRYELGFPNWRYALNELVYYAINVDSYVSYVGYRLGLA